MNKFSYPQAAGLLGLLAVGACADPISDVKIDDWAPEVALPLLETSFTLRDALEDAAFSEYVEEGADGGLRVGLREKLFDYRVSDNVPLVNLTFPLATPETVVDPSSFGIVLPVSLIDMTGVTAVVQMRNDYPTDATVTVTTDNIALDGVAFEYTFTVPAGATQVDSFAVATSRFELSDDGTITMRYAAELAGGQVGVQMSGGSVVLKPSDFTYAEGPLTEVGFELQLDSTAFPFFDAFEPGTISLVNPTATVTIENSVGAPVRFTSPDSYVGYRDGSRETLVSPFTRGLDIAYPAFDAGPVPQPTVFRLDESTSNFADVLSGLPTHMNFTLACELNAEGAEEKFFIHRDARVRGDIEIDVPLALRFDGFEVERDFAFDGSGFDEAASAEFLLKVDNGFGLGAKLQLGFLDAGGEEIAEAFPEPVQLFRAATVDALGKATANASTEVTIPIPAETIALLREASAARVTLQLDSPEATAAGGADFTQLYYDNAIAVRLGALITLDGEAVVKRQR